MLYISVSSYKDDLENPAAASNPNLGMDSNVLTNTVVSTRDEGEIQDDDKSKAVPYDEI